MTSPRPSWDPAVRWQVQHAVNIVCQTAQDVLRRHTNGDGLFQSPSEVEDGGDVHGLIAVAEVQVLDRLAAAIASARAQIGEVQAAIDADQRARYGDAWKPITRPGKFPDRGGEAA